MDQELVMDEEMEPDPKLNEVTNVILAAGFEVHTAPSDSLVEADEPESRLALMRVLVKECLGWLYYRVAGYI